MDKTFDIVAYKQRLIQLLKAFHDLCLENNLTYYIAYGTALGAIRHHGIIPWDDDIDVCMPRHDYERLLTLPANDDFEIVSIQTDPTYDFPFAKLYDRHSTLVETKRTFYIGGIFIDIFPLDGVPDDPKECELHDKQFSKYHRRLVALTIDSSAQDITMSFRVKCFLYKILYNKKKTIDKCDALSKNYLFDSGTYVRSYHGPYGNRDKSRRAFFGDPVEMVFEGVTVLAPSDVNGYLTDLYGDYMIIPPASKRKPHHIPWFIDMERRLTRKEIKAIMCNRK